MMQRPQKRGATTARSCWRLDVGPTAMDAHAIQRHNTNRMITGSAASQHIPVDSRIVLLEVSRHQELRAPRVLDNDDSAVGGARHARLCIRDKSEALQ